MVKFGSVLEWGDYVVIAVYFLAVIATGIWASHISKSRNLKGYFLASRSMHWIPVGTSLFVSNIGSEHLIGLAGSGAAGGIAIAVYELNAIFVVMILGWIFVPVYMSAGVYTMPEYIKKRFGGQRIQLFLSCLSLILYILTKISAILFSGALFIKQALGFEGDGGLYLSVLILMGLSALFTIGGGLTAVMWTDFVQSILMIVGALVLTGLSLKKAGGYEEMLDKFAISLPSPEFSSYQVDVVTGENKSCSTIEPNFMHLVRPVDDPVMPWTGYFSGILIGSIWYWCADQVTVQRTLSAKNLTHAKSGVILTGILKLTSLFTLVIPGMAARVLYTNEVACSHPERCKEICFSETGCSNIAFIKLVLNIMPHGIRGTMLAVMLAAVMSSLTSIFNSASTIFTVDIWTRIRKNKTSMLELLIVGRCFIIIFTGLSIAWIPIISQFPSSQLFIYIQTVTSYLAPPVAALYVMGLLWPRINEQGAFWGLIIGVGVGLVRLGLELGYKLPSCGSSEADSRPDWIKAAVGNFHYLHYSGFSFLLTCLISWAVSFMTKPIPENKLYRLTFQSRHSTAVRDEHSVEDNADCLDNDDRDAVEEETDANEIKDGAQNLHNAIKILSLLCCLRPKKQSNAESGEDRIASEEGRPTKKSKEELALEAAKFLNESKFYHRLMNILAVVAMCLASFVWGFYA